MHECTHRYARTGRRILNLMTWLGLGATSVIAVLLAQPLAVGAMQAPPPDVIQITGNLRDFQRDHVDFNVVPSGGYGHYALLVGLDIGAGDKPAFRGMGFRVDSQWRDGSARPIAPHLWAGGNGMVLLASAPTIGGAATVDTWDSDVGPYGGGNVGPAPDFYVGAEMPVITVPPDLEDLPTQANLLYTGPTTTNLNADIHCNQLRVRDSHTLRIIGNIRILCETRFEMADGAAIEFQPNSSLTLYTTGIVSFSDSTVNADTWDPSVFTIYHLGNTDIRIADLAQVYGTIIAPNAGMLIEDGSNFYGNYTGQTLTVANGGGFHLDESMPFDACGVQLNDTKGPAGIDSAGGINSVASFGEWYADVMGTNLSIPHTIDLVRNGAGVYEFLSNEFYPVDGQLFGNEGDAHNNYFTFTFTAEFTYAACGGQFFEFMGSDDAWLFVDRDLAIDLGGIIPGTDQHVELDRLNLVDGQTYTMHFFYAQRNPTQAVFRVRTNVPLIGTNPATVNAGFD